MHIILVPNVNDELVPKIKMSFDTDDQVYGFYNIYTMASGFDTCKCDSRKKHDITYYKKYVCNKHG